jgi:ATP-dependent protease Clp ATPase subunit
MEDVLGEQMFKAPSDHTIEKIVVKADCVTDKAEPQISRDPAKKPVSLKLPGKKATAKVRHS